MFPIFIISWVSYRDTEYQKCTDTPTYPYTTNTTLVYRRSGIWKSWAIWIPRHDKAGQNRAHVFAQSTLRKPKTFLTQISALVSIKLVVTCAQIENNQVTDEENCNLSRSWPNPSKCAGKPSVPSPACTAAHFSRIWWQRCCNRPRRNRARRCCSRVKRRPVTTDEQQRTAQMLLPGRWTNFRPRCAHALERSTKQDQTFKSNSRSTRRSPAPNTLRKSMDKHCPVGGGWGWGEVT